MKTIERACSHPLFRFCSDGAWHEAPEGLKRPCVFVFDRERLVIPSPEQVAKFRCAKRIVESLGGRMIKMEWECAGTLPPFAAAEVIEILQLVRRENPGATIVAHWNGEGCYTLSVGVDFGDMEAS